MAVLPSGLLSALPGGGTVVRALEDPPLPWVFGLVWRADNRAPMAQSAQREIRRRVPKPARMDTPA